MDSALGQFPVIGPELSRGSLHGSGLALGLGIAAALWAGIGVFLASQNAMNHLWGVPFKRRPDPIRARGRALLPCSSSAAARSRPRSSGAWRHRGRFRNWLEDRLGRSLDRAQHRPLLGRISRADRTRGEWRQLRGGAIGAGVLYELLQTLGGYYVGHVVKDAGNVYGTFALVIGLLSWIYLGAHITLLAAEGNVVATRRLWPRSFSFMIEQPATEADKRALTQRGKVEERRGDETVSIEFPSLRRSRRGASLEPDAARRVRSGCALRCGACSLGLLMLPATASADADRRATPALRHALLAP